MHIRNKFQVIENLFHFQMLGFCRQFLSRKCVQLLVHSSTKASVKLALEYVMTESKML